MAGEKNSTRLVKKSWNEDDLSDIASVREGLKSVFVSVLNGGVDLYAISVATKAAETLTSTARLELEYQERQNKDVTIPFLESGIRTKKGNTYDHTPPSKKRITNK